MQPRPPFGHTGPPARTPSGMVPAVQMPPVSMPPISMPPGSSQMYGMVAPPPVPALGVPQATNSSTSFPSTSGAWLFLGGFSVKVPDSVIEKFLALIGEFVTWKRIIHPIKHIPLPFGFAQFKTATAAAKASRILQPIKNLSDNNTPLVATHDSKISVKFTPADEQALVTVENRIKAVIEEWEKNKDDYEPEEKKEESDVADEDIAPEDIAALNRIEPRAPGVSDEIWNDIVEFREMQARNEILNDRRRKRKLLKIVSILRKEAREKLLEEKRAKETASARPTNRTQKESKKDSDAKPEVIDHSLLKSGSLNMTLAAPTKKSKRHIIASDEQEDESKKKRKLVPLKYTEEEEAAVKTTAERLADVAARISKSAKDAKPDWTRIGKKVEGLVVDFIGEADPSLVSFVLDKLKSSTPTETLISSLRDVLDEDAEDFVKQLQAFV